MSFWDSRRQDSAHDFDDYDPTPYAGGYDQSLTYGRPLPHSEETCYSVSNAGDVDFERPQHSSNAQTSVYKAEDPDLGDRYGRPQRQGYGSECGSEYGGRPKRDEGVEGYGVEAQYGSGYGGSGYRRNEEGWSGHGGHPQRQDYGSEYGSGYGRGRSKSGQQEESYGRGGGEGYGNQSSGGGYYGRSDEVSYGGGEYRNQRYGGEEDYGGGDGGYKRNDQSIYGVRPSYDRPNYEGYGEKLSYGDENRSSGYNKPGRYDGDIDEGFGRVNYGNDSYDYGGNKHSHEKKHHHHRNYDED